MLKKIQRNTPFFLFFMGIYLLLGLGINYFLSIQDRNQIIQDNNKNIQDKIRDNNKQARLALSWLTSSDVAKNINIQEEDSERDFFQKSFGSYFQNNLKQSMQAMADDIKPGRNHSNLSTFEEFIDYDNKDSESCKNVSKKGNYKDKWYILQFQQKRNVNYQYGIVRDYSNTKSKFHTLTTNECIVFSGFMKYIKKEILEDNEKIEGFNHYSKLMKKYFFQNNHDNQNILNLKPYFLYVARMEENGKIITYPSFDRNVPIASYNLRPWGKAANHNISSNFSDQTTKTFGLTPPYITNPDDPQHKKANIIRTAWYKFSDNNSNYVLCLDFFFDSTRIKSVQDTSFDPDLKPIFFKKVFSTLFGIPILILSILTTFLYRHNRNNLKKIILRTFNISFDNFSKLQIELEHKYIAENTVVSSLNVESTITTSQANRSEEAREAGWSVDVINIQLGQRHNNIRSQQNENIITYKFTRSYNLKIQDINSEFKRVETWKAKLKDRNNNIKEIGNFVAEWKPNRSTDSKRDLNVISIHWEAEYEDSRQSVTDQLFEHLLMSENESFIAVLDPHYTSSRQPKIPDSLQKITEIKNSINYNLSLQKRKVTFNSYKDIVEMYFIGQTKALCCVSLLNTLKKAEEKSKNAEGELNNAEGELKKFLTGSIDGIIYLVENRKDEFRDFYQSMENDYKSTLKNQSNLKIMVFQENISSLISPQDNFCIVKIENKHDFVVSALTDDSENNAGWITWREVDINFYTKLYDLQTNLGRKIQEVNNYLNN